MSVQSVERAFAILRCLASGPAGVSAIAERVELPRSTVSRLLSTLQEIGVVEQIGAGGEYRVGDAITEIAEGALPSRNVLSVARPWMLELVNEFEEAAGLSVIDGKEIYCVDQVDADNEIQVRNWAGEHVPVHSGSPGLVLLAYCRPEEQERLLAQPLEPSTERTMTDPISLRRRLQIIADQGHEWVYEEFAVGLNSVAAPIRDESGKVIAALHMHGPSYRFPPPGISADIAKRVVETADRISARLANSAAEFE